jgi:hypothetical protein
VSAGIYALIGVVVGGFITVGGQAALAWWQAKKRGEAEWLVAARLVSAELDRLLQVLRAIILDGEVSPTYFVAGFFSTAAWEQHHATVARWLPNDPNDPTSDEFWRGLSRIYGNLQAMGAAAGSQHGREKLDKETIAFLRGEFEEAARAYEALTGSRPDVQVPPLAETGAATDAEEPDSASG